jgi:hypothetical protein
LDIGAPIYHTTVGDQTDWVVQSQKTVLEQIARQEQARLRTLLASEVERIGALKSQIKSLEAQIAATSDSAARDLLQDQLDEANAQLSPLEAYVKKQSVDLFKTDDELWELSALLKYAQDEFNDAGARWELTAVRAPQRTVDAAARTPYSIFLSRIDRTRRNPTRTFDTGLRINPFFAVGSSVETLDANGVTRATGNYTTHFEIRMDPSFSGTEAGYVNFIVADDPLHLVDKEDLALAEPGVNYNKQLVRTVTFGSGYMTFAIRSTPGPLAAVVPTKIRITGNGTWLRHGESIDDDGFTTFIDPKGGITPFAIKMGEAKFQSTSLFPDFSSSSGN